MFAPMRRAPAALLPALLVLATADPLAALPQAEEPGRAGGATVARQAGEPGRIERAPRCPRPLEVLVEAGFGRRRGLRPGDTLRVRTAPDAAPCPAAVSGLFRPRADPARLTRERPRVLFHLPDLAELTGREREVDRFSVALRPGADRDSVRRDLARLLPGTRVLTTSEVAERSSTTFSVVQRFHRAIGLITLTAGSVFLACIMILKVQERRSEVAALRLVGVSRRSLLGWIVAEAALISVLGGALGIGVGHAASDVINRVYQRAYDTSLVFSLVTADTVRTVLVLAVVLGLGAGLTAGLHLLSLDPLEEIGR